MAIIQFQIDCCSKEGLRGQRMHISNLSDLPQRRCYIPSFSDKERLRIYISSRHPEVLWAQRSDKLFLTVCLPDAKNVHVKLEPDGKFSFSATDLHAEPFQLELELFGKLNREGSKINIGLRNIFCVLKKEEKGWWKRLLKSEGKPAPYIKVDWNKWCDEDEEELSKSEAFNLEDMNDISKSEATDDDGSDDEGMLYLPDLEKARDK